MGLRLNGRAECGWSLVTFSDYRGGGGLAWRGVRISVTPRDRRGRHLSHKRTTSLPNTRTRRVG
jgi:hypothetical protein